MNLGQRLYRLWLVISVLHTIIAGHYFSVTPTPDIAILFMMGIGWTVTALAGILSHRK